ncbi:hypothetical protein [Sphingobacterium endophyticum]|uniref:hypothetical protein n=1 Tax=Sphingobacterium endophyticum TaxID=2546448 RepID=UPI0012E0D23F|nr:hypothetical protein [Sphingobacterium endophyticum]
MSANRKIIGKALAIVIVCLLIGCKESSFRKVDGDILSKYENPNNIEWTNIDSSLVLYPLIDNGTFFQEYNILLALRYYNGNDSIYYVLRNTQIGNYVVRNDKLYVYDRNISSPGTKKGWYESTESNSRKIDSIYIIGDSVLKSSPDLKSFDIIAKVKPYGIYKIDYDTLKVIAKNGKEQKKFLENIYTPGFYYFSSPGLGLERIYNLSLIEEKLKNSLPTEFDAEYY